MGQGVYGHNYIYRNGTKYLMTKTTNHNISITGVPHSVCQKFDSNGSLEKERYYDNNGHAELDIDYTDHGNPTKHTKVVPHEHKWDWSDPDNPRRRSIDD